MSLERSLALFFLTLSIIYSYTAFFVMDAALLPFAKMSPIWPSSFPKIVSIASILLGLSLVLSKPNPDQSSDIDMQTIQQYQWKPALGLLAMMVAYALLLRTIGFIIATFSFLIAGSAILGERKFPLLIIIALVCTLGIWYLVQQVLGIYLRPWPWFMSGGF